MEVMNLLLDTVNAGIESVKIFNLSLIDFYDFGKLIFRLAFNSLVLFLIINLIYQKSSGRKEFTFTYYALGTAIFLLCYLLEGVKIELGFALGLFAVFGILKYRTDAIPIREMTYLFVIIGIAVVNALVNKKVSLAELVVTNGAIICVVYFLEKYLIKSESSLDIIYEKIENIRLDRRDELKADLETRTGLKIKNFSFMRVDFLKDTAMIRIYFDKKENKSDNAIYEQGRIK